MVHTSVAVSEVTTELAIETDETRNSNAGRLAGWNGRALPEAIGAQARTLGNGEENRLGEAADSPNGARAEGFRILNARSS